MLTFLNGIFGAKSEESMAHLERSCLEICATITRDHQLFRSFFGLTKPADLLFIKKQVDYQPLSIRFTSFVQDSHDAQKSQLLQDLDISTTAGPSSDASEDGDRETIQMMETQVEQLNNELKKILK